MKTLEEIYNEVLSDETLTSRYQALKTPEEQAAFVKELGGEASAEEIAAFLAQSKTGELSDAELDQVVGGKSKSVKYIHDTCGGTINRIVVSTIGDCYYLCSNCNEAHDRIAEFAYHEE